LGERSVYPDLIDIATKDENVWLRISAIDGLGKIGNKEAIPFLKEALKNPFVNRCPLDVSAPAGFEDLNCDYPIRDAAFSSLVKLGVGIECKSKGVYNIVE
ncbi:MAG: HEAT repeat domain-containing protein, partial [Phycisphaerae bacterium]|nr:HEAT repeat domain-containing protein [Phycisphaerae bacterium]